MRGRVFRPRTRTLTPEGQRRGFLQGQFAIAAAGSVRDLVVSGNHKRWAPPRLGEGQALRRNVGSDFRQEKIRERLSAAEAVERP